MKPAGIFREWIADCPLIKLAAALVVHGLLF